MANENVMPLTDQRELKNWISSYVEYVDNTEAPIEYHLWSAISTIAGALNRKCWLNMGIFNLYPSFYIVFVAPPGVATKSTTAGTAMSILKASKTIKLFEGSVTWQAVLDELADNEKQIKIDNKMEAMSCVQFFASELGVLIKKDDNSMIDLLVDVWDGKSNIERRTKGTGIVQIARPYINLIGCTTPSWLVNYAESYMIEGGFFSRTIFVYADKKAKTIAYPQENINIALRTKLELDLKRIGNIRGEFTLTDEAKEWGKIWYEDLWNNPPDHLKGDNFQSYIARRQTHLHKTAMIISAAQRSDRIITLEDMLNAEQLLVVAESHLNKIHEAIMADERVNAYKLIVRTVKKYPQGIVKNDLYKMLAGRMHINDFHQGVESAQFSNEIGLRQVQNAMIIYPK